MKRRELLECAALLIGGVTASQAGFSLTQEQKAYLANAPAYIARDVNFFNGEQRFLIDNFAEIILPETDTPGARQAGVPKFIELMVAEWLNGEEQRIFLEGLNGISAMAQQQFGKAVMSLNSEEMLAILEQLEETAADDPWYQFGNSAGAFGDNHKSPFICQLKELTIWGFFTSEVGVKKVLRYNPMPMSFKGDIPLHPDDSSWSGKLDE